MKLSAKKFGMASADFKRPPAVLSALALLPLAVVTSPAAFADQPEPASFEVKNEVIVKKADGSDDPDGTKKINNWKEFIFAWECTKPNKEKIQGRFSLQKDARTNNTHSLLTGSQCTINEVHGAKYYLDDDYTYQLQFVTDSSTESKITQVSGNNFSFTITQPGSNGFVAKNVYTPKSANNRMEEPQKPAPKPKPAPSKPKPNPQQPSKPQSQPKPAPEQPKQDPNPVPGPKPAPQNPNHSQQPKDSMPQKNPGVRSNGFSLAWILAPLALLLAAIGGSLLHWFHR